MDQFLNQLQALADVFVSVAHTLGIMAIPVILVILCLTGLAFGRGALEAVGKGIIVATILVALIANAGAIGKFLNNPTIPKAPTSQSVTGG